MLRTGLYNVPLNPGKLARVAALHREYRRCAKTLAAGQWKLLFTTGRIDKNVKLSPCTPLSARYVQTCQYQVVGALAGFHSNCANAFKDRVRASSLDEDTRIALLYINKYQAWYKREVRMQGQALAPQVLRLARNIMRNVLACHRKPDLGRCNMALDAKVAVVERASKPGHFERWVRLSTLDKGSPVLLPVGVNPWFEDQPGRWQAFMQLNGDGRSGYRCGLVKDVAPAPYAAKLGVLGLDVGLTVLLATSEGDLLGHGVLERLASYDRQISALAANRQRAGLRVRSRRYDALVQRMKAFLKNEVHRTLRQALLRHRPTTVSVELLDFRSPRLSRRMNRLVSNFGRTEFNRALDGFAAQYGFAVEHVEPAYSSQRCSECGYVDRRNRQDSVFRCLHCGHRTHADVNAARNHAHAACEVGTSGRSGTASARRTRHGRLQQLVSGFATAKRLALLQRRLLKEPALLERRPRRHSSPRPCMLSNPYFDTVLAPLRARAAAAHASAPQPL